MNDYLERISSLVCICDHIKPNSTMIEIGCLRGESTFIFNSTGKFDKIYCIDPWAPGYDPKDVNSGIDFNDVENSFDQRLRNYNNIIKWKTTSISANLLWDTNLMVDLIYIDACHTYDAVKEDISIWKKYVKPGGIIAGHDYGPHENWSYFPGVELAVNEIFGKPDIILPDTSWVKILK